MSKIWPACSKCRMGKAGWIPEYFTWREVA
jgi:hypothetical protein